MFQDNFPSSFLSQTWEKVIIAFLVTHYWCLSSLFHHYFPPSSSTSLLLLSIKIIQHRSNFSLVLLSILLDHIPHDFAAPERLQYTTERVWKVIDENDGQFLNQSKNLGKLSAFIDVRYWQQIKNVFNSRYYCKSLGWMMSAVIQTQVNKRRTMLHR